MAELLKKPEAKKYEKNSKDSFGNVKSKTMAANNILPEKSETSKQSSTDPSTTESNPLPETTQKTNTRVISLQSTSNKAYEFDVDTVNSWEQSSGTLSYGSHSPNPDGTQFRSAKKVSDFKDIICHAKLNQCLLCDSMPSQKILSVKSLKMINEEMRQKRIKGCLFKRIAIPCKQNENTGRYELISKIIDDAINEYMSSSNHKNKLLEINLECGGNMLPRFIINGINAERSITHGDDNKKYDNYNQMKQVYKKSHSFQHLSTCSPPVPYPSANTFGRCTIEDYVKLLKGRGKIQK